MKTSQGYKEAVLNHEVGYDYLAGVNLDIICHEFGNYLSWVWALFVVSDWSLKRRKETQEWV